MTEGVMWARLPRSLADELVRNGLGNNVQSADRGVSGAELINLALMLKDTASVILAIRATSQVASAILEFLRRRRSRDEVIKVMLNINGARREWTLKSSEIDNDVLNEIEEGLDSIRRDDPTVE